MEKISKETIEKFNKLQKEKYEILSIFEKRIDYIIKTITKEFGLKMKWWEFWGDGDYQSPLDYWFNKIQNEETNSIDELCVNVMSDFGMKDAFWVDDNCFDWCWERSFPSKWIMNDFEEELKLGHAKHLENLEKQNNKANEEEMKTLSLQKIALSKLTDEEKKALGIKE